MGRVVIPGFRKIETGGGGEGTTSNYEDLANKPSINGVPLTKGMSGGDLHLTNEQISESLSVTGDTANNIVSFTSADAKNPTQYTDVDVLATGEKHKSIFAKISTMFKNIRYLYKMLGTTDISSIGDGTATGAISTLNSNISDLYIHEITSTTSILELFKVQKADTIQSYFIRSYTLLTDYPASLINDQGTVYPYVKIERPRGVGYIRITAVTNSGTPKQITGYTNADADFIIWGNIL